MYDNFWIAVYLENPDNRVRHLYPELADIDVRLREMSLQDMFGNEYRLTDSGRIAQALVRHAHPRQAYYRRTDQLHHVLQSRPMKTDTRLAIVPDCLAHLQSIGLAVRDDVYDKAEAWKLRR